MDGDGTTWVVLTRCGTLLIRYDPRRKHRPPTVLHNVYPKYMYIPTSCMPLVPIGDGSSLLNSTLKYAYNSKCKYSVFYI